MAMKSAQAAYWTNECAQRAQSSRRSAVRRASCLDLKGIRAEEVLKTTSRHERNKTLAEIMAGYKVECGERLKQV